MDTCILYFQAAKKVEIAIRGKSDIRLKDLSMMGFFSHTGCNEVLNNLHTKVILYGKATDVLLKKVGTNGMDLLQLKKILLHFLT
jgi:hypothetical protein